MFFVLQHVGMVVQELSKFSGAESREPKRGTLALDPPVGERRRRPDLGDDVEVVLRRW